MATAVGLNFSITASIAKFQASIDQVQTKLAALEKSGKETAGGMKLLAGIEIGKLAVSGISSMIGMMTSATSTVIGMANEMRTAADAVGKLSSATGFAHEPLQVLSHMADLSGVGFENFSAAARIMGKNLGDAANGTGEAGKALQLLGLDVNSLLRLSPEQQFIRIAKAIDGVEDPAKRSAAAAKIFGESGIKLIPMFANIEQNAAATADEMLSLGMVLSKLQIQNVEAMNDSFTKVYKTAFSIGSQVLANFAPMLEDANNKLLEFVKNFQGVNGETGGQGLANFLTEAFFTGVELLAGWSEAFINGLTQVAAFLSDTVGTLLDATASAASWFADESTVSALQNAANAAHEFAESARGFSVDLSGPVKSAIEEFRSSSSDTRTALDDFKKGISESSAAIDKASSSSSLFEKELEMLGLSSSDASAKTKKAGESVEKLTDAAAGGWMPLTALGDSGSAATNAMALLRVKTAEQSSMAALSADTLERLAAEAARTAATLAPPPQMSSDLIGGAWQKFTENATFFANKVGEAMGEWDQIAQQKMQQYLNAGFDPKFLEQRMQFERQVVEQMLKQRADFEHKKLEERFAREEKMAERTQAARDRAMKRITDTEQAAADAFMDKARGFSDWYEDQLSANQNAMDMEQTLPELETQTGLLGGILDAANAFGENFAVAAF